MRLFRLAAAGLGIALAALPPGPARTAEETAPYARCLDLAPKGTGAWTGRLAPFPDEGELTGLAVVADWWEGPGDGRVGDEARARREGFVYEVKRGDGAWTALPAAARDLRLVARAPAPPEAKGLAGGAASGEWSVRQTAGGEYPKRLRLEFACRAEAYFVVDLRVASVKLAGLEPPERAGRPYIPDRMEIPALDAGAEVTAVVVVENCGARETREVDLDVSAVPFGKRQGGKRIGFAQVPRLAPGASKEIPVKGKIPADLPDGACEVLAVADPRASIREVDTLNNALGRAFVFKAPEKKKLPDDLRDR